MPTLRDQILDEAQELAVNSVLLPDASDDTIVDAISDIVGANISTMHPFFNQMAIESYRYWEKLRDQVESAFTGWYDPPEISIERGYEDGA